MLALCLYTVTGWGVMSCVCVMAFQCGSTLFKVPLLQAETVAICPQMFDSDVNPQQKQTHKQIITKRNLIFYLCFFTRLHVEVLKDLYDTQAQFKLCNPHPNAVTRAIRERHEVDGISLSFGVRRKPRKDNVGYFSNFLKSNRISIKSYDKCHFLNIMIIGKYVYLTGAQ